MDYQPIILAIITAVSSISIAYLQMRSALRKRVKETTDVAKETAKEVVKETEETVTKAVADEAVKLENRLTTLENKLDAIKEGMITRKERACIVETQTTLNWALISILGDAVNGLKNPPTLDVIFTEIESEMRLKGTYKAAFDILDKLTTKQDEELTEYLQKTIASSRSPIQKQRARLVLGMKKLSADLKEKGVSCTV